MITVTVTQARETLSDLLGKVQHGREDVTIERHGKPVAVMISVEAMAYYEALEDRLPNHGEPVADLQSRGILLDGSTENNDPRLLLQIFGQAQVGPLFFEFIQRKRDEGFGNGNFTALFKSMEEDQLRRGTLKVTEPAE